MVGKDEFVDAYATLNVQIEASEAEIRRAYRLLSLKVHPDRHPNNPDAATKFHELNFSYELLLDPSRRSALDAVIRTKLAHKARVQKFDAKRKGLQDELEEAERAAKRLKEDKVKQEREKEQEAERIKEEGRQMRLQREEELRKKQEEIETKLLSPEASSMSPVLGPLDTTVRLKYPLVKYPDLITPSSLKMLLMRFGPVDESSILLSIKPPKKAPTKPPKFATALVPFDKISDAHAAVCSSESASKGFEMIEISWAGGKEPEALEALKLKHSVDPANSDSSFTPAPAFSFDPTSAQKQAKPPPTDFDFESITLMRLRQAERERLEREIVEEESKQ